jgi:hypothetical protein
VSSCVHVFLGFGIHVCLPASIDPDPGYDPNIITSIFFCNLLAISSTGRHCTGTTPTHSCLLPIPAEISTGFGHSARNGCFNVGRGSTVVDMVGFVQINYWIRDLSGISFIFFAVFAGVENFGINPAPNTEAVFWARPGWMLPRRNSGFS